MSTAANPSARTEATDAAPTVRPTARPRLMVILTLWVLAASYLWFLVPGRAFSAIYTNDLFVLLDGIHRLDHGYWPSLDFSTPLGGLAYAMPYLGYEISGSLAMAVPMASWLLAAAVLPMAALLLASRADALCATITLLTLGAMAIVPVLPGDFGSLVTWGMPYNRWGWMAILTILLAGLPRVGRGPGATVEGVVLATLTLFLALLKVTYFAVAVGFLGFAIVALPELRRAAAIAASGCIAGLVLIEAATGLITTNVADLIQALASSGTVRSTIIVEFLANLPQLFLVGIAIAAIRHRLSWREALFAAFVIAAGVSILNQNYQREFIYTLLVVFLLAIRHLSEIGARSLGLLLITLFLMPQATNWALASIVHLSGATHPKFDVSLPRLDNFAVGETDKALLDAKMIERTPGAAFLAGRITKPRQQLAQPEYIATIKDAIALLERHDATERPIFVVDFLDSISVFAGVPPPAGGYSWIHDGRNISEETAPPAKTLFAGVQHVLVPQFPVEHSARALLTNLYTDHIVERFERVGRSSYWVLYRRHAEAPQPASE